MESKIFVSHVLTYPEGYNFIIMIKMPISYNGRIRMEAQGNVDLDFEKKLRAVGFGKKGFSFFTIHRDKRNFENLFFLIPIRD